MYDGTMWSEDENGTYWLLFPNKHALTKVQIKEIFSQFGKVLNVRVTGDSKGFRFVNLASLEDVQRAVNNLTNHPTIKLVPHRPNKKNNTSGVRNIQNDATETEIKINKKGNFVQKKAVLRNLKSNKKTDSQNNEFHEILDKTKQVYPSEGLDRKSTNDTLSSGNSNFGSKLNIAEKISPKIISCQTSPASSTVFMNLPSLTNSLNKTQMLQKFSDSLPNSLNSYSNNINNGEDEVPQLVAKIPPRKTKRLILNAEEVIVGNIPKNYGSAYILHLFDQFEPLAISYIKKIPNSDIRYCHVYFKKSQDSLEVETQFDDYTIEKKKLIVLRPCRLIQEAVSCNILTLDSN